MDSSLSSTHHVVPEMTSVPSSNTWPSTTQPGLPSRPPRVAIPQASYNPPVSSRHCAEAGDPVYGEKVILSHHRSSVSDGFSVMSGHTADTIDLEKAVMVAESQRSHHSRRDSARNDVAERQHSSILHSSITGGTSPRHHCANSPYARYDPDAEQDMLDARQMQESNAARILLFLSLPCVALSFLLAIYTLLATLALFLTSPIRLCTNPRSSLWTALLSTLTSAQRLQLRCIYYSPPSGNPLLGKSVAALLANLLLSPILSLGVAIAAWTVAVYWVFAAIVGDPDGSEGGNDGVDTVMGLRGWWERWLVRGIVE